MKKVMLLSLFLVMAWPGITQNMPGRTAPYKIAIGTRANVLGLIKDYVQYDFVYGSYKQFFSARSAFEVNAGISKSIYNIRKDDDDALLGKQRYQPFILSLSYQLHIPMTGGVSFVIGGAGVAQYLKDDRFRYPGTAGPGTSGRIREMGAAKRYIAYGFGPVGGFDYKFKKWPVNLTLDHRPAFLKINVPFEGEVYLLDIALAARYTF